MSWQMRFRISLIKIENRQCWYNPLEILEPAVLVSCKMTRPSRHWGMEHKPELNECSKVVFHIRLPIKGNTLPIRLNCSTHVILFCCREDEDLQGLWNLYQISIATTTIWTRQNEAFALDIPGWHCWSLSTQLWAISSSTFTILTSDESSIYRIPISMLTAKAWQLGF